MEVILLEKVEKLGGIGDSVKVKDGYAKNFLLPKGKALRASKDNVALFEAKKEEIERKNAETKKTAESVSSKLKDKTYSVIRQAGDTGHLFGSVNSRDVAKILKDNGVSIDFHQVRIADPIKEVGLYEVKVVLHPEVIESVRLNVARSEEEAKAALDELSKPKKKEAKKVEAKEESVEVKTEEVKAEAEEVAEETVKTVAE